MTTELFNEFTKSGPEAKLELIESQLVVGNSLIGSRLLLRQIMTGWGANAALALAPIEQWLEALCVTSDAPAPLKADLQATDLSALRAWADAASHQPEDLFPGARGEGIWLHNRVRSCLSQSLWSVAKSIGANSLSRDFVMRLGNKGFTPDVILFKGQPHNTLYDYYLGGPADLVVEVLLPGHEDQDRVIKQNYYATGGVLEYWLVNPAAQEIEFWRLIAETYQQQPLDNDGCYRPSSAPNLMFAPTSLWCKMQDERQRSCIDSPIFSVEGERQEGPYIRSISIDDGLGWGGVPFAPQIQLEPVPITFEQYIAWSPEAKFEFSDGKPQIGGDIGIRNLIGLLLMTFGLTEVVKLLPPSQWVNAIAETVAFACEDGTRKADWWQLAHQAAAMLREKYGMTRLGVIGDLVHPTPLNYWSKIEIVTWETPERRESEIY